MKNMQENFCYIRDSECKKFSQMLNKPIDNLKHVVLSEGLTNHHYLSSAKWISRLPAEELRVLIRTFANIQNKAVIYFCKNLHLRRLTRF